MCGDVAGSDVSMCGDVAGSEVSVCGDVAGSDVISNDRFVVVLTMTS